MSRGKKLGVIAGRSGGFPVIDGTVLNDFYVANREIEPSFVAARYSMDLGDLKVSSEFSRQSVPVEGVEKQRKM
jgi:hypothetical protein